MQALTREQWQWLWSQRTNSSARPQGNDSVNDWLFEMIVEAGYDVRDDAVVKLAHQASGE